MNKIKDWLKRDFQRTNKTVCYFLSLIGFALAIYFYVNMDNMAYNGSISQIKAPGEVVVAIGVPENSYNMKITAFSSFECKTNWCINNPELNGHQVALNKKFGKWSKVYIPAFDKTYEVIGTTDYKTDLDIYFGSDYQGACQFGTKTLLVNLIK
jgi:hypothetical protein